ncbi:cysteine-rich hydrophobic domain-containing protein 2-like [Panonychus citri]|uniref:cysteine-rich hydrophobic domain-containing protein 2-like n=1 Tax=Panonychus citri TaxID=50023 RepID=UPI00230828B6|nr:cysteine-rich hydrophobic domain-containing protein 2-like [Panonychus citri]
MAQSVPCSSSFLLRQQFDDIIEEVESHHESHSHESDIISMPDIDYPIMEQITIRGNGNMTLFGLSNTFSNEYPTSLIGKVSREEFEGTINRVNNLLKSHHSINARLLLVGCLCCCCSFGCSLLWPTLALSKRTRSALEKLLYSENNRLYHKLGLNWKLGKERCHNNNSFMDYVLIIEFLPKYHIYLPD